VASNEHVYAEITDRVIAALEKGTVPWHKPWSASVGRPTSMSSGKPYHGVNVLLLGLTAFERGYSSPFWCTFNQAKELGGQVKKGQSKANGLGATYITLWKTFVPKDAKPDPETGQLREVAMARLIPVFNSEQIEGLPERFYPEPKPEPDKIESAEAVIGAYLATPGAPKLAHDGGDRAYYQIDADEIHLPLASSFDTADHLAATLYHELTHATGHPSRLDIPESGHNHFGDSAYSKEELRAEMGAAFLAAETGLDSERLFDNSAAYVASWLQELRADPKLVIQAASAAQKAADLIIEPSLQKSAELPDVEIEAA
jgi:antirestriction protein ArdC